MAQTPYRDVATVLYSGDQSPLVRPGLVGGAGLLVALGDSITNINWATGSGYSYVSQRGFLSWGNVLLGQRFTSTINAGVNGDTSAMALARLPTLLQTYHAQWYSVLIGINDILNGVSIATTLANIFQIWAQILDSGANVIAFTILPCTTVAASSTMRATLAQLNYAIRVRASITPGVYLVDGFDALVDSTSSTGAPRSGVLYDGIHTAVAGAQALGTAMAATLSGVLPPLAWGTSLAEAATAAYPYGNLITNPVMNGTGGTNLNGNSSGNVPTSWFDLMTVAAGVNSKVTRTDIAGASGFTWAQSVMTFSAAGADYLFQTVASLSSLGVSTGDQFYLQAEMNLVSPTAIRELSLNLLARDASTATLFTVGSLPNQNESNLAAFTGVLRTPVMTVPASTEDFMVQIITTGLDATSIGTRQLGRIELRKVYNP